LSEWIQSELAQKVERKTSRLGLGSLILGQKDNDNFFMPCHNFLISYPRDGTPAASNRSCNDHPASSSFRITPYDSEQSP
jgi:hypothetical protein